MSNETIADIAAEIRDIPGDMFDGTISMFEDEFHSYADRIEAAAKREECELLAQIAELRQKIDDGKFFTPKAARDAIAGERPLDEMLKAPLPTGNAAAMREALELCVKQMCANCRDAAHTLAPDTPCVYGCETLRIAKEALQEGGAE